MFAERVNKSAASHRAPPALMPQTSAARPQQQPQATVSPVIGALSSRAWDWSTVPLYAPDRARSEARANYRVPDPPAALASAKRDGPEGATEPAAPASSPTQTPAEPISGNPAPAAPQEGDVAISGSIPDIRTPPGGGRATSTGSAAPEGVADTPGAHGSKSPVIANIHVRFCQPRTHTGNGTKQDAVTSGVAMGAFSQPGGRAVAQFGSEFYEPAFTGIHYAFAGGKCTISANLDAICPWGTNAGGCINVPTGTSSVITASNWQAIRDDLKPARTTPFKSPRDKYYSQPLVERHEKFHGTDDLGWTRGTGLGIVKTKLEAGSVSAASAAGDVAGLVDSARTELINQNGTWYKGGGADHDAFAGEIRAYADGRPHYQALANAVEATGNKLVEAEQTRRQIERERLNGATEYREGGRNVPAP